MLIVSTVVNRWLQDGQSRRRRIAVPSSVERESTTRVSAERQNGQYMTITSGHHDGLRFERTGPHLGIALGMTCPEPVDGQPQPVDDLHGCNY
jgi:hypothetical protein